MCDTTHPRKRAKAAALRLRLPELLVAAALLLVLVVVGWPAAAAALLVTAPLAWPAAVAAGQALRRWSGSLLRSANVGHSRARLLGVGRKGRRVNGDHEQ
jgi:hypothetical protein